MPRLKLADLIDCVACLSPHAPLGQLAYIVANSDLSIADVNGYVRFCKHSYSREPVIRTDDFEVMVLSWLPGQSSPVHNHRGSACCVRVLQGGAVETLYTTLSDGRFATERITRPTGTVLASEDADIHTIAAPTNTACGLVTLHIYRPALTQMELFDVVGDRLVKRVSAPA